MHETIGPYLDKACVGVPNGIVLKHGNHLSRPPTREYQQQLLQRIEDRIAKYSDTCSAGRTSAFTMGISSFSDERELETSNSLQVSQCPMEED